MRSLVKGFVMKQGHRLQHIVNASEQILSTLFDREAKPNCEDLFATDKITAIPEDFRLKDKRVVGIIR
jgi:hypothetical protein